MSETDSNFTVSKRSWGSLTAVLIVQAQNAFNDNFVKLVLTGLAMAVAAGTPVGENIQYILFVMIPLPFILLAPVAGYLSDRFSKRDVIFGSLLFQLVLFVMVTGAVIMRSVEIAIFGYFLLAVQSTIFSPAKQGILKEIVGSERLGFANGLMSMLTMVGILGGMLLAGRWFDGRLEALNKLNGVIPENGWQAALVPMYWVGGACLVALIIGWFVEKTPSYPREKFTRGVWVRHFLHLRQLFAQRRLRTVALFITSYWFVANYMGVIFVNFAKQLYPDAGQAGRMEATAEMLTWVGGGLIVGSTIVSLLSRKRIRLPIAPFGGFGMALALVGVGLYSPGSLLWNLSLSLMGFASGFYVVPLNAWLQDLAEEDRRARIISALNLMTSFSGVVAVMVGFTLDKISIDPSGQIIVMVPFLIVVAVILSRFLTTDAPNSK
jgi:acyl-[acyl-carrier-protein]-phospholipid O-acyltransferase/long-chain-fatty-acid--[acyl-carrier-protein] ligase